MAKAELQTFNQYDQRKGKTKVVYSGYQGG